MRLVLASGSPRRRELLTRLGWPFVVRRPDIDETPFSAEAADRYVARLSREKALAIPSDPDDWIIAADTTVALEGQILGKPLDFAEAAAMLRQMRHRDHLVYTGLTLRLAPAQASTTTVTTTRVTMRDYDDAEITRYVTSGEPFDKAGGYAIQDALFRPVANIDGCYANVMGLPLCVLGMMLAAHGANPPTPIACRADNRPCVAESVV